MEKILCFGDSLTANGLKSSEGWVSRVQNRFAGKADVVCRGFSGYNSRWALNYLDKVVQSAEPERISLVVLWFGANDAVLSASGSKQFVPVDEYAENLTAIVDVLAAKCVNLKRLVLLTPPPIEETMRLEHQKVKYGDKASGVLERTNANTKLYAKACANLCRDRLFVGHIDVYSSFMRHGHLCEILSDGLHLTDLGNEMIFEALMQEITESCTALAPENLPSLLPEVSSVDHYPGIELVSSGVLKVFRNGNFWDWSTSTFKGDIKVAVRGGQIVQVTDAEAELSCAHPGEVPIDVDLCGQFVLPGLSDSHIHIYHMGENSACLNLMGCTSIAELKDKLRDFCAHHRDNEWIMGVGWDHERMGGVLPSRFDLDEVIPPGTKVFMWRVCFHIAVASTAALQSCGVPLKNPPAVAGGSVDEDAEGNITGVLRESAVGLVLAHVKEPDEEVQSKYILDGLNECLEAGLTSVQTNDGGSFGIYKKLDEQGKLPIRVYLTAVLEDVEEPYYSKSGMLVCDRIKLFTDGALGANTAALRDGDGKHHGILIHTQDDLDRLVATAKERNLRVEAHAIGDAAAESVLLSFSRAGLTRADRPIITHCQILGEDLIDQMAYMGTIANVQPTFVPTDAAWVMQRIPASKLPFSYCWKTLINKGIPVSGSSDCPVETCKPLQGMFDAVFRPNSHVVIPPSSDSEVFNPLEKLSFSQSLFLYTLGASYAARCESRRGRIEPGFDADWTIVDQDVAKNPGLLARAVVQQVYIGGDKKFQAEGHRSDEPGQLRNNGAYARGKGGDPLHFCRCPHGKSWSSAGCGH